MGEWMEGMGNGGRCFSLGSAAPNLSLLRDSRICEGCFEQGEEVSLGCGLSKVGEIEAGGLDLEDAEDVVPLPFRDTTTHLEPTEFVQDGIFGACEVESGGGLFIEEDTLTAFHFFDGFGGLGHDKDVGFEHGGKVDDVERRSPSDGFFDHVGVDVKCGLKDLDESGDVSSFEGCDEIDVLGGARDSMH